MGLLTQEQIISEAGELAGHTGLAPRLQVYLPLLLQEIYQRFKFGFSYNLTSSALYSSSLLQLSPGVQGYGVGGLSPHLGGLEIHSILGARLVDDLRSAVSQPLLLEQAHLARGQTLQIPMANASAPRGKPRQARAYQAGSGLFPGSSWAVAFDPVPDRTYWVDFIVKGYPSLVYSATDQVPYFNDKTILEGLVAYIYRHKKDEREFVTEQKYQAMVKSDVNQRMVDLQMFKRVGLSPFSHRRRGSRSSRAPDWLED